MPRTSLSKEFGKGIKRFAAEQVKVLGTNVVAELVEATPVDIGWARSNWLVGMGSPPNASVSDRPDSSDVNAQAGEQSAGISALLNYKLSDGRIYIVNGVPYIGRLNDGSSTQAPKGFIQEAIKKGVGSVSGGR